MMKHSVNIIACLVLALACIVHATAAGGFLIGVLSDYDHPETIGIVSVDPTTGAQTSLKPFSEGLYTTESAYDPSTGVYTLILELDDNTYSLFPYNVKNNTWGNVIHFSSPDINNLRYDVGRKKAYAVFMTDDDMFFGELDLTSGMVIHTGSLTGMISLIMDAAAYDPVTQYYYAYMGSEKDNNLLVTIDASTGKIVRQVATTDSISPIFFSPTTKQLLCFGNGSRINVVDPLTGKTTPLASAASVEGLPLEDSYDFSNGNFYAVMQDFEKNRVLTVDAASGKVISYPLTKAAVQYVHYVAA
jgi:DNA-binding beta-propeller fold protein YncE